MEQICEKCTHFIKHYIYKSNNYVGIIKGHCTYPRRKTRKTTDKACEYFKERDETDTNTQNIRIFEIEVRIKEKA